ncbi:MAG: PrsW family intramembrane metalloprotease [Gammaproteobacteria bacterium]|nr:MAG: PrsW family intramembrane metalloprotease [Gammaproteobacteria bacterium]
MSTDLLLRAPIALVPVLLFLAGLVQLDAYKLLRLRMVLALVAAGALAAGASYLVNNYAYGHFTGDFAAYSSYVAPWIEESLKAVLIVFLIRTRRVGLPVDAGIAGHRLRARREPVLPRLAAGGRAAGASHPRLRHRDHARRHDDGPGDDLDHALREPAERRSAAVAAGPPGGGRAAQRLQLAARTARARDACDPAGAAVGDLPGVSAGRAHATRLARRGSRLQRAAAGVDQYR